MQNPLVVIEKIKNAMDKLSKEDEFLSKLNADSKTLLNLYSADFVGIMLKYYPGATVMMHRNYHKCAIMIASKVYDSNGITKKGDYHIAEEYEMDYIRKTFNMLSYKILLKLLKELLLEENEYRDCYTLRKNREYLT